MRLLLDTNALLWWLAADRSLGRRARALIADAASSVFVSAATVWEIAIKRSLGKLDSPSDLERQIEDNRFVPMPVTLGHAWAAGHLPRHHDDPFDRMLVAQAAAEGLAILTADSRIGLYGIQTVPARERA
ncbi:MAG: type II toxin-antitoxin system VapC family toxin [Actinomycetota bacterium]